MNKKRIILLSVSITVIITAVFGGIVYHHYHPTHYLFNDKFILGNTYENIVARYGKFSIDVPNHGYLVKSGGTGSNYPVYYMINFENGVASEVFIEKGGWGG